MMDKVDILIKDYLKGRGTGVSGAGRSSGYPDPGTLYAYLTDELKGAELERFLDLLKNDADVRTLVVKAREAMEAETGWEGEKVPAELLARAQGLMASRRPAGACPHCGKPITPFKKPLVRQRWRNALWLFLAAASFALSFVFPYRFAQFLAVSLLAGIKAIVEIRATRTQILIYKALSEEDGSEQGRLHRHSSRL